MGSLSLSGMALFDWLKPKSTLGAALARGLQTGDIHAELEKLGETVVKTRADGQAVCDAILDVLAKRCAPEQEGNCYLSELADLCQEVEGAECGAFPVIAGKGMPLLKQLTEQALNWPGTVKPGNVLLAVKVLSLFGAEGCVDLTVRLVRKRFHPTDWMWTMVFKMFQDGHPLAPVLFAALTRPLPDGFLGLCLLDTANQFLIAGGKALHPFDSEEGITKLSAWLAVPESGDSSYAVSAAVALAFLSHPEGNRLLRTASMHPSANVRLEAAWAEAKLDRDGGFASLVRLCMDLHLAVRARRYLEELGRGDLAPDEMSDPDFHAQAEFMDWISHPNELGRPPDEMHILDRRTLDWPPEFTPAAVWLLVWIARDPDGLKPDQKGVGMTGTRTWCFFAHDLEQRPPEDIYALHCCRELEREKIVFHFIESGSTEYDGLLEQWQGPPLQDVHLTDVVELESVLRHPQKLLAAGDAKFDGAPGWVVLDGAASRWYPARDFPENEYAKTVLKIHTGRRLLGFPLEASRAEWLREPERLPPPDRVIAGYERLLDHCLQMPEHRQIELLGRWASPLSKHFGEYVDARVGLRGERRSSVVIETYQRLLSLAEQTTVITADRAFETDSPLYDRFADYVKAMDEEKRAAELMPLVHRFLRLWPDYSRPKLGLAALKAGDPDLSGELLTPLKEIENWHRREEVESLALLWLTKGEPAKAGGLMLECLQLILADSLEATGSDIKFHEKFYQSQREAAFRVIHAGGVAGGIESLPESTLKPN
jgi:hypothetical protein